MNRKEIKKIFIPRETPVILFQFKIVNGREYATLTNDEKTELVNFIDDCMNDLEICQNEIFK